MIKCFTCDLDLTSVPEDVRNSHANKCLDKTLATLPIKDKGKQKQSLRSRDEFAGVQVSNLGVSKLRSCPVCNFGDPSFSKMTMSRKLNHLKACSKVHGVPISDLVQRVRESSLAPQFKGKADSCTKEDAAKSRTSVILDYLSDSSDGDDAVKLRKAQSLVTPKRAKAKRKKADENSEELQLALTLSASLAPCAKPPKAHESIGGARCTLGSDEWRDCSILASLDAQNFFFTKTSQLLRDGSLLSLLHKRVAKSPDQVTLWSQSSGVTDSETSCGQLERVSAVLRAAKEAQDRKIMALEAEFKAWHKEMVATRDREVIRILRGEKDTAFKTEAPPSLTLSGETFSQKGQLSSLIDDATSLSESSLSLEADPDYLSQEGSTNSSRPLYISDSATESSSDGEPSTKLKEFIARGTVQTCRAGSDSPSGSKSCFGTETLAEIKNASANEAGSVATVQALSVAGTVASCEKRASAAHSLVSDPDFRPCTSNSPKGLEKRVSGQTPGPGDGSALQTLDKGTGRRGTPITDDMFYDFITHKDNWDLYESILQYKHVAVVDFAKKIESFYQKKAESPLKWYCDIEALSKFLDSQGVIYLKKSSRAKQARPPLQSS